MYSDDACPSAPEEGRLSLLAAADLQDHLMTASHDLERLQALLTGACDALISSFYGASEQLSALEPSSTALAESASLEVMKQHLGAAITALQFQDMASQLVAHTNRRLRNCADRLAAETMGDDEDGAAVIESPPLRPNPVTQDEMDAGSVELF